MWNSSVNKFNLGDIVSNTDRLSNEITGSVIGIMTAAHYCRVTGLQGIQNLRWTAEYPTWILKPVYFIWLDVPGNPIPYATYLGDSADDAVNRFSYSLLPVSQITSLPEDDLTLIRSQIEHEHR